MSLMAPGDRCLFFVVGPRPRDDLLYDLIDSQVVSKVALKHNNSWAGQPPMQGYSITKIL